MRDALLTSKGAEAECQIRVERGLNEGGMRDPLRGLNAGGRSTTHLVPDPRGEGQGGRPLRGEPERREGRAEAGSAAHKDEVAVREEGKPVYQKCRS